MAIFLEGQADWSARLLPELSEQEAKVVFLYAYGFSLRTIAADGKISAHTVSTYLARAKGKFEVQSLSELRIICMVRVNCLKNKE